jgi:RNA polymerase primary sigma factor
MEPIPIPTRTQGRRARSSTARLPSRRAAPRPLQRGRRLHSAQELAIVVAAQHGGDQERERLVDVFTPSIAGLARIYRRSSNVDWNELMQDGVVGLLRALERFNPDLNVPFWGYASWWVRQAMQQLVSERSRPIVLSDRALRQLARVKDAQRRFEQSHRGEPSCGELAAAAGLPRGQVENLLRIERKPRGLEESAGGQAGEGATVGDLLADPTAEEPYETATNRVLVGELPRLLARLSARQRAVICARYGIGGDEQTLRQVAGTLGVSAERVRQIEQAALDTLAEAVCAT